LAKFIVDVTTGQIPKPDPYMGKDPQLSEAGKAGGLKGGLARAKKLSPAKIKEIAQKGATARWQKSRD
jgi:hypothetical protein